MTISALLIPELEMEIALTEKFIKRIPDDKLDWKAHEKSMSILELINHLSEIPSWLTSTMTTDELSMDNYVPSSAKTKEEVLATLKKNGEEALASLKDVPNEAYSKPWKMMHGETVVMEMPKYTTLRSMVLNQFPHHRAQLGVYLRLLGESVPATYGRSADEE